MSSVKQRYRDISPVTLQLVGGAVSSSLYCEAAEGVSSAVESFLVEVYRCKVCQFTCGLKSAISSHLLLRHRPPAAGPPSPPALGCLAAAEEAGLHRGASPYQQEDDDDFLLYNMLENMSPPTCDISSEGGLHVAHTCEVSTLFEEDEEESAIFPLKAESMSLACCVDSAPSQEEMAQSAHLRTLGLCRISSTRGPPSSARPPADASHPHPHGSREGAGGGAPGQGGGAGGRQTSLRRRPQCPLCPVTLASKQLLNVHVRCHRADGGWACPVCGVTAASWAELEPHWRRHRRTKEGDAKREEAAPPLSSPRTLGDASEGHTHPDDATGSLLTPGQMDRGQTGASATSRKTTRATAQFCCSLCHRTFSSKLTLRRHLGVHGGHKPFSCPQCPYSSRLKASLRQHMRTHTGEKPYKCVECSYASIDRSSLIRHSRTHSEDKPYRCSHCSYSSIQKKSLDLHARRHHTGQAFPCQLCDYSSPDRQLLRRHVLRHHAPSQHATAAL